MVSPYLCFLGDLIKSQLSQDDHSVDNFLCSASTSSGKFRTLHLTTSITFSKESDMSESSYSEWYWFPHLFLTCLFYTQLKWMTDSEGSIRGFTLQMPKIGRAETSNQKLNQGFPCECQVPSHVSHHPILSCRGLESEATADSDHRHSSLGHGLSKQYLNY